jgi:hypothetical protein
MVYVISWRRSLHIFVIVFCLRKDNFKFVPCNSSEMFLTAFTLHDRVAFSVF